MAEKQVKGGIIRAEKLSPERRAEIARQGALARWQKQANTLPQAVSEGLLPLGEIHLQAYVLKDKRRVFHKKSMGKALGLTSEGGNVFLRTINSKGLASYISDQIKIALNNPIVFQTMDGTIAHGYEGTVLIDICDAIWEAKRDGALTPTQHKIGLRAEFIFRSSAKLGIVALIDEATGYIADKDKEEYRNLFRQFLLEECRGYESEFPDQIFDMIYAIHKLPRKHKNKHPQFFGHFFRKYIYTPLANSNGLILEMLDEKNPVVYDNGGRRYKMHPFLTKELGIPALKAHYWQLLGIWNATKSKIPFEKGFKKAFPQIGDQQDLFDDQDFE